VCLECGHRPRDGVEIGALAEGMDALVVGEIRGSGVSHVEAHKGSPDLRCRRDREIGFVKKISSLGSHLNSEAEGIWVGTHTDWGSLAEAAPGDGGVSLFPPGEGVGCVLQ